MEKPKIRASLTHKMLEINGERLRLEDILFKISIFEIKELGENMLTLKYDGEKGTIPEGEIEKIYGLLKRKNLTKKLKITSRKYEKEFPKLSIAGKFKAEIYS